MKRYNVAYPIAGSIYVEVVASSEEEAIEKAPDAWGDMSDEDRLGRCEWEFCNPIAEGNILHAPQNEAEAEEVETK